MADSDETPSNTDNINLTSKTPIFGQKLYVVIAITVITVTIMLITILICFYNNRNNRRKLVAKRCRSRTIDNESIEKMEEIKPIIKIVEGEIENVNSGSDELSASRCEFATGNLNLEWGKWYGIKEIELATRDFATENVVGEGGYGVVYRGVLCDGAVVAVKSLLNNKGQAEKEFKVEVEAIGKVRHKNLVGLIGFCVDGAKRLLVYEYIDNGNLEQWLHGDVGPVSPLTWDIRMKIAIGTAKGLAYLHEGLEPKVVHRNVKSSNILLDKKWNAKVSDFGLAKLLGSEKSYVTTRVVTPQPG